MSLLLLSIYMTAFYRTFHISRGDIRFIKLWISLIRRFLLLLLSFCCLFLAFAHKTFYILSFSKTKLKAKQNEIFCVNHNLALLLDKNHSIQKATKIKINKRGETLNIICLMFLYKLCLFSPMFLYSLTISTNFNRRTQQLILLKRTTTIIVFVSNSHQIEYLQTIPALLIDLKIAIPKTTINY